MFRIILTDFKKLIRINRLPLVILLAVAVRAVMCFLPSVHEHPYSDEVYKNYTAQLEGKLTAEKTEYLNSRLAEIDELIGAYDEMQQRYTSGELTLEEYSAFTERHGRAKAEESTVRYLCRKCEALKGCNMLLMGNPSWPASALMPPADLLSEIDQWISGGGWLILDERSIDFTYGSVTNSLWSALRREPRTALIRSFSDSLALTVCPLCYAVGGAGWIQSVRAHQFAPAVSPLAHCLIPALEHLTAFRGQTVECVTHLMSRLVGRLRRISGLKPLPHDANWVLCCLERQDCDAAALSEQLKRKDILIHPCIDSRCFTLGLRVPIETDRFIKAARKILMQKTKRI